MENQILISVISQDRAFVEMRKEKRYVNTVSDNWLIGVLICSIKLLFGGGKKL